MRVINKIGGGCKADGRPMQPLHGGPVIPDVSFPAYTPAQVCNYAVHGYTGCQ